MGRNSFEPLAQQAKKEEIILLFGDSMHCVMGVFLCFVWFFKRLFVRSSPGRQRINVVGAVNAITKKISIMTNAETVNGLTIMAFLTYLREVYLVLPIYIRLPAKVQSKCICFVGIRLGVF